MRDPDSALTETAFSVATAGGEETEAVGEAWGRVLEAGDVLLLEGDLGAGKTTLVRGLARGLGILAGVKSPTFVIHLQYPGRLILHHLDLYRIGDPADLSELDVDDVMGGDGVCVVEWGDRLGPFTPEDHVRVRFREPAPDRRELAVSGTRARVERLARASGSSPSSPDPS